MNTYEIINKRNAVMHHIIAANILDAIFRWLIETGFSLGNMKSIKEI